MGDSDCVLEVRFLRLLTSMSMWHGVRALRRVACGRAMGRHVHTEARLEELGITLPSVTLPKGSYQLTQRSGNLVFTAGHLPVDAKGGLITGKVGADLSPDEGKEAARRVGINLIATLKNELGDLDRVKQVVKVFGLVHCTDDFTQQPHVLNGFSDLMAEVFGERGVHARSAVGTNSLPLGIAVEIEAIVEVEDSVED